MKALTEKIIGAAIEVHKTIGPGLLESAHEARLAPQMRLRGLNFARQAPLPVARKGVTLDRGHRPDLLVGQSVVLEPKAVAAVEPIHEAELLPHVKPGRRTVSRLSNFNVPVLEEGIRRGVLNDKDLSASSASLR